MMSEVEAKRRRMSDLLDVEISAEKIALIVGVSRATVFNVASRESLGVVGTTSRSDEFLMGVAAEIEADPTIGIRKLGKDLEVSKNTVSHAVRDLGAFLYARRHHQLLMDSRRGSGEESSSSTR